MPSSKQAGHQYEQARYTCAITITVGRGDRYSAIGKYVQTVQLGRLKYFRDHISILSCLQNLSCNPRSRYENALYIKDMYVCKVRTGNIVRPNVPQKMRRLGPWQLPKCRPRKLPSQKGHKPLNSAMRNDHNCDTSWSSHWEGLCLVPPSGRERMSVMFVSW